MKRDEIITALRAAGYDGPISYTKTKLEELLTLATNVADQTDAEWEGEEIRLTEWCGLHGPSGSTRDGDRVPGTLVKVEGIARKKFEFISYYRSSSQEYVTVRGPVPGRANDRYIEPKRILHGINGKPVLK